MTHPTTTIHHLSTIEPTLESATRRREILSQAPGTTQEPSASQTHTPTTSAQAEPIGWKRSPSGATAASETTATAGAQWASVSCTCEMPVRAP
jgi:hypothetical protein